MPWLCVVDHDGKAMWILGIGHPDTCYVGKIDAARSGLQISYGIEPRQRSGAVRLVDALSRVRLYLGHNVWVPFVDIAPAATPRCRKS
jgi:hypothetical protein